MKTFMALLLLCLVPLGTACADEKLNELTVDQVAARLKEKGFYVFDNNDPETYKQGHVPGAKYVDYNHVSASDLPADKNATLVFYCANEH